jgi:hypothetical protein
MDRRKETTIERIYREVTGRKMLPSVRRILLPKPRTKPSESSPGYRHFLSQGSVTNLSSRSCTLLKDYAEAEVSKIAQTPFRPRE